jgi:hypothetical protein
MQFHSRKSRICVDDLGSVGGFHQDEDKRLPSGLRGDWNKQHRKSVSPGQGIKNLAWCCGTRPMALSKKDFLTRPLMHQLGIAVCFAILAGFVTTLMVEKAILVWEFFGGN